jgi:hypothetical protein
LLTRLERGLEKHRAAVAAQAAPPPAAPAPIADIPQQPVTPTTVPVPDLHPDSPVAAREPMPPASAVPADERKADDLLDMPFPAILELLRGKMRW